MPEDDEREEGRQARSFATKAASAIPLPPGEGGRVRIDELERLRALAQEAVDEGGLPGPVGSGEEDESGHMASLVEPERRIIQAEQAGRAETAYFDPSVRNALTPFRVWCSPRTLRNSIHQYDKTLSTQVDR